MKIKLISLILATVAVSPLANAADGTISFKGSISAQTCTVNGGTGDFTVALPTVSADSLAAAGQTAGRVPFNIALTKCSVKEGKVRTFFEPGSTVDTSTGRLKVDAGGASNVQIGLQNADYTDIKLGAVDGSQNSKSADISKDGAATLSYYAQYVATGAATSGAANSSVMYTLVYP